jgi:hypothetical protein
MLTTLKMVTPTDLVVLHDLLDDIDERLEELGHVGPIGPVKVGAELELGGDHGPANTVSCQEQNFADQKQVKLK